MATPILSLAAAATEATEKLTLTDALPDLLGFAIVVVVLLILWGMTNVNAKIAANFDNTQEPAPKPVATPAAEASTPAPAPTTVDGDLTDEDVVIISAAIAAVFDKKSTRVVSIRSGDSSWSTEGRRRHFSSHNLR